MSRQVLTPCDVALAVATLPLMGGVLVMKALSDVVIQAGQASEEIFRGDRLPILHQPTRDSVHSSSLDTEE